MSLSKIFLAALFVPALVLSTDFAQLENEVEKISMSCCHQHKCAHNADVFASYRNNRDMTVQAGGKVLFNVTNANKGDGVNYHRGVFTIKKAGFYLINYGLASIGNAGTVGAAFGFNLVRTRNNHDTIVDSLLTNDSSAIILFLQFNDKIKILSQEFKVHLIAGNLPPRTTSLTDTAQITFLRLDR